MIRSILSLTAASILLLSGCSDEPTTPGTDAGVTSDGALADAASTPDSGEVRPDSGVQVDSGFPPPACNPINGSGCPTGRTCIYAPTSMAALCVDISATPVAHEGSCDVAQRNCAVGYSCLSIQAGQGRCFKLCDDTNGDADCSGLVGADPNYQCGPDISGSQWSICTGIPATVTCEPTNDTCPTGQYCDRVADVVTGCITEGTAALGASCSLSGGMQCARGGVCMGLGSDSPTCMKACDAEAGTGCGANESCLGINVGGQRLGFGVCEGFTPCTISADPTADTCGAGLSCQTFGPAPTTACRDEGPGTPGQDCTNAACAKGNVCMNLNLTAGATGFKCWQVCDANHACGTGTCTGLSSYDFDICVQQ